jgi:hypothetical protein
MDGFMIFFTKCMDRFMIYVMLKNKMFLFLFFLFGIEF